MTARESPFGAFISEGLFCEFGIFLQQRNGFLAASRHSGRISQLPASKLIELSRLYANSDKKMVPLFYNFGGKYIKQLVNILVIVLVKSLVNV